MEYLFIDSESWNYIFIRNSTDKSYSWFAMQHLCLIQSWITEGFDFAMNWLFLNTKKHDLHNDNRVSGKYQSVVHHEYFSQG